MLLVAWHWPTILGRWEVNVASVGRGAMSPPAVDGPWSFVHPWRGKFPHRFLAPEPQQFRRGRTVVFAEMPALEKLKLVPEILARGGWLIQLKGGSGIESAQSRVGFERCALRSDTIDRNELHSTSIYAPHRHQASGFFSFFQNSQRRRSR
jgi:hypothetical protein